MFFVPVDRLLDVLVSLFVGLLGEVVEECYLGGVQFEAFIHFVSGR